MGCCTSAASPNANGGSQSHYDNGNEEPEYMKRTSRLIPYSDDDPIEEKIKKIYLRWRMNRNNIIEYMSMLKFDSILQMSIKTHLPPTDDIEYDSVEHLMDTLRQNEINKSIFCQYWKMEKYISSKKVIERHINVVFSFKKWKINEQLSYVNNSDLELFEQYNPVINTKTVIREHMKMGDILVVLKPRWHETRQRNDHNKTDSQITNADSIIKVHSFTPFNSRSDTHIGTDQRSKKPFKLKMFPKITSHASDTHEQTDTHSKELSTSPYNAICSDNEDIINTDTHELIPIKLTDFQKYITMQAMCVSVTVSERELLTLKTHSKLKSVTLNNPNINPSLLTVNNPNIYRPSKKLTDLNENESTETSVVHHDTKPKHNRFYFTLCADRTSALLKIQELVIKINKIVDDLSFLYSIVAQASMNNLSPSQYIQNIKETNRKHLLSLTSMNSASFINICGGLAKYWSDIDDERSILRRVQSALQFSALGSVFMYPKDYAARTKWKVGDSVMIFKQSLSKWCPGKIIKLFPKMDDIQVKYAILHTNVSSPKNVIPPPLMQGNENETSADSKEETQMAFNDIEVSMGMKLPKHKTVSVSDDSNEKGTYGHVKSPKSRIHIMDANKLAKIDFVNDTTLETIRLNRYDRDFVRPMVIKNQKRASLSVTIDNKVNKTSELLCPLTGLGNAVRLHDRLQNICDDTVLCGMIVNEDNTENRVEIIEENTENKDNETIHKKRQILRAKNIHPLSLMLIEIDQLSSKINLSNRPSEHLKRSSKYSDEKYNEDFIMLRVSKILDNVGKKFNKYQAQSRSHSRNGSDHRHGSHPNSYDFLNDLESSQLSNTDSFLTQKISVKEDGKVGNSIKSEAFRYGHNIFALLLHNCDVAKSLIISRFVQKEMKNLCNITTEFKYDEHYLSLSMALANLHYDTRENGNRIMDTYRTWYKRCSDALKTIRYEGGNGVTHADVLFGVQPMSPLQSRQSSANFSNGNSNEKPLEIGILHTAGSAASEPGIAMQFQNSLNENHFNAFASFGRNLIEDNDEELDYVSPYSSQPLSPNTGQKDLDYVSPSIEPVPNNGNNVSAMSPTVMSSTENNKTITWITGRLDRKYTFV